jgi:hypothetical protein
LPDYCKIIYKVILYNSNLSIILPQIGNCGAAIIGLQDYCGAAGLLRGCNYWAAGLLRGCNYWAAIIGLQLLGCRIIAGLQEHGGVRGEARFPPGIPQFPPHLEIFGEPVAHS